MKLIKKSQFLTVLLGILLVSVSCSLLPSASAVDKTQSNSLKILDEVVGINTASYNTYLKNQQQDSFLTLAQQTADFNLISSRSNLRVSCSFVGDLLRMLYISDCSGDVSLKNKASNVVDDAKGFLQRYQDYTKDAFYNNIESMLDTVSVNQNVSKTMNNLKLDVSVYSGSSTTFIWTYVDENGVEAPTKNVVLSYEQDNLKSFVDNWQLYSVASEPKISKEQAIDYALNISKGYSITATTSSGDKIVLSDFVVESVGAPTLCYLNYREGDSLRGSDPFILYPSWYVPLGFDKVYFGEVSGVYVRFWADSGEISDIVPMNIGYLPQDSSQLNKEISNLSLNMITIAISLALISGFVTLILVNSMHKFKLHTLLKCVSNRKPAKFCTGVLCVLLFASLLFTFVPGVQATSGAGAIYASTYHQYAGFSNITGDAYFDGANYHYNVTYDEPGAAYNIANTLDLLFAYRGYDTYKNYGNLTYGQMLSPLQNIQTNYDNNSVFYFGHMHGNDAYWVYVPGDEKPYNEVTAENVSAFTTGKTFFAWSWTCMSGESPNSGLAYAWTKSTTMSSDGYNYPDTGDQNHCYIGFHNASPSLSAACFQGTAGRGDQFILNFYYYALGTVYSIHDSLNLASYDTFGVPFVQSSLYLGYNTYWPEAQHPPDDPPGWYSGQMYVYGNSNIHFEVPVLYPSVSIYAGGYVAEFGQDWYINVPFNIGGANFESYDGVDIYYNLLPPGIYNVTLPDNVQVFDTQMYLVEVNGYNYTQLPFTIDCRYSPVSMSAVYGFQLNVSSTAGGSTDLTGVHRYPGGSDQNVNITATPDSGYVLNYWVVNGQYYGSNPMLTVPLINSMDIVAVFCPEGYETRYSLTVEGEHWFWGTPIEDAVFLDGQFIGLTNTELSVGPGYYNVSVSAPPEYIFDFEGNQYQNWTIIYIDETNSPMTLLVRYYI